MTKEERAEKVRKKAIKKASKICVAIVDNNTSTLESCIESTGVPKRTFYSWVERYSDVAVMFEAAREKRIKKNQKELVHLAYDGIRTLLNGKEWEEVTVEAREVGGNIVERHIKKVKKFIMPNPATCMFTLKALGGLTEKQQIEHSGSVTLSELFDEDNEE